jgi:hypothetical protein
LPHRSVLATSRDKLPGEADRELSLTTEVIGPELGEDSVPVFLRWLCIHDWKHGKSPEGLHGMPDVGRDNRTQVHPGVFKHRPQNRLRLADQHEPIVSFSTPSSAAIRAPAGRSW